MEQSELEVFYDLVEQLGLEKTEDNLKNVLKVLITQENDYINSEIVYNFSSYTECNEFIDTVLNENSYDIIESDSVDKTHWYKNVITGYSNINELLYCYTVFQLKDKLYKVEYTYSTLNDEFCYDYLLDSLKEVQIRKKKLNFLERFFLFNQ